MCNATLVDSTAPMSRVHDGRLVLKAACIGEGQRLETNYEDCWFTWDYHQCAEQKDINRDFRYALLGYKEQQPYQRTLAKGRELRWYSPQLLMEHL